jgi:hypothetical protein
LLAELIERGYHVTFITGSAHRKLIEDIGASFVPLEGYSDFTEEDFDTRWPEMKSIAPGPEQLNFYMENMVINAATSQFEVNQKTLKFLREKYSGRKIIQCTEGMFYGALLPKAGVPGLQSDGVISLNVLPVFLPSIDTAPFGKHNLLIHHFEYFIAFSQSILEKPLLILFRLVSAVCFWGGRGVNYASLVSVLAWETSNSLLF